MAYVNHCVVFLDTGSGSFPLEFACSLRHCSELLFVWLVFHGRLMLGGFCPFSHRSF